MRIGIDIDGVVANTQQAMLDVFQIEKLVPADTNLQHWVDWACWDIWPDATEQFIRDLFRQPAFWESIKPMDYAIDSLRRMIQCGHDVVLVTARGSREGMSSWVKGAHPPVHILTREWLHRYDVPYDDLIFNEDKRSVAREERLLCFVEDRYVNACLLSQACEQVYLLDAAWNQGELPDNVMRTTWREMNWWRAT